MFWGNLIMENNALDDNLTARGRGRPKGSPNKVSKALKDMILEALDDAGGKDYLLSQASENPQAFMTLLGKILPSEIKAEVGGSEGGPIIVSWRK